MALQILENKGNFYILGNISCENVFSMKQYIEAVFKKTKYVTIDITQVTKIDIQGVLILSKIYKDALLAKKVFTIIGVGSKDLYDHFSSHKSA
jgi:ABC-type transporter Mla MlaB component|tara:strand:+ start:3741 stop:4019 length:279 start_codon:yes stop_codon:yes gene_type:complete